MTTSLINTFRTPKSGISAQDLLKLHNSVVKNGMLRKKASKMNIGKWPQIFVVLTHDSLFVYKNEFSKLPKSKFSLLGYNKVCRCEIKGHDWCFSIVPARSVDSVKEKTFTCFSNAERKAWMVAIRAQMYTANNINRSSINVIDKIKSMAIGLSDEDDYIAIERKVYETDDEVVNNENSEDEDSDSTCDSDSEDQPEPVRKTIRSVSLPHNSLSSSEIKRLNIKHSRSLKFSERSCPSEFETSDDLVLADVTFKQSRKRQPSDPQPRIPSDCQMQLTPPRYSQVCKEEEPEHDYVNFSNIKIDDYYEYTESLPEPSLVSLCFIVDTSMDRDQLITLLQTKQPGTYLIRKSRTADQNVLSFLARNGQVKEYKIFETSDDFTIDHKLKFTDINDLLKHYSYVGTVPNTDEFLKRGIHHLGGETGS